MKIILSSAKKMRSDLDGLPPRALPQFIDRAERLRDVLRGMSYDELKKLWKCNDQIAALNVERLRHMDLHHALTPALFAYDGIAFQYMRPNVFADAELSYVENHLRILSGFYGVLRPFDGVTPYRLEMGAKLSVDGCRDLYSYWGGAPAESVCAGTNLILNLASKEYSQTIEKHLPPSVRFVTVVFGEHMGVKTVEKGTMCKMVRGKMVRWMAEQSVKAPEELTGFDCLGYRFCPEESDQTVLTFLRKSKGAET